MPNYHPLMSYAAQLLLTGRAPTMPPPEFMFIMDRADLRNRDVWWVYFDERTGMHVAVKNPHLEPDADDETGDVYHVPTHEGVAVLPEFADTREYWTHGWHVPVVAPTMWTDVYDEDVYDALREADFSD